MADSMGRIIQLLSVLSDMQTRKQQLALQEQQMAQQRAQFAQQMGFNEKSEMNRVLDKLLDRASQVGSGNQQQALTELAQAMFPDNPQAIAALQKYGQNAPMSLEMLRTIEANRGMQPGATPTQREAYTGAVTGMNQGQVQTSQMQNFLGGNMMQQFQQNPGMATQMAQGFGQFTANRQTPLQAAQDQSILNDPRAVGQSAAIGAGLASTDTQLRQFELSYAQLHAAANELNSKKALSGALSPEDMARGFTLLREARQTLTDRNINEAYRLQTLAEYNRIADIFNMPDLKISDPNAANDPSILDRMQSRFLPQGPPSPAANPLSYFYNNPGGRMF